MNQNCSTCAWRTNSYEPPKFCWEPEIPGDHHCLNWSPRSSYVKEQTDIDEWVKLFRCR